MIWFRFTAPERGFILTKHDAAISGQISWVYTHDLDSTAYFYAGVLGLECSRDQDSARIFATGDNAWIGVCQAFSDRVVEPKGGMISIISDDVDAWYQRLVDIGLSIDQPPRRLEQFGIYTFSVNDPNGYVIEFQQFVGDAAVLKTGSRRDDLRG
jgi:predicted enzyme related to lactoylglutathione lyase